MEWEREVFIEERQGCQEFGNFSRRAMEGLGLASGVGE